MLINGEKWACDACVRGHRVSNCQHYDRPLQHINKKGRPVTQCQHCRSQRKNRSAHIKCDCGEKTTKCIHLGAIQGHRESCCCNHGGRCTCAFKKDADSGASDVTEKASAAAKPSPAASATTSAPGLSASGSSSSSSSKTPIRRRRANTTRSESTLSIDEHGRHKTSFKHSKAQKASPYPSNRINSVRSTGVLTNLLAASEPANDDEEAEEDDRSSGHTGSDSGADDNGSISFPSLTTPSTSTTAGVPMPFSSLQQSQQRRARSETASPLHLSSAFPQPHQLSDNSHLPPLSMSSLNYAAYTNYNAFNGPDQPLYSASLSTPPVDWSQFFGVNGQNGLNNGNTDDKFSNADSYGFSGTFGYEYNGSEQAPTMTTATSGDVSEAEDLMVPGMDDYDIDYDGNDAASNVAYPRAGGSYHMANSSVSLRNTAADYHELRLLKADNKFLPTPTTTGADDAAPLATIAAMAPQGPTLEDDEAAIWMPEYHGLPSMTESPESDVISFWGAK